MSTTLTQAQAQYVAQYEHHVGVWGCAPSQAHMVEYSRLLAHLAPEISYNHSYIDGYGVKQDASRSSLKDVSSHMMDVLNKLDKSAQAHTQELQSMGIIQ